MTYAIYSQHTPIKCDFATVQHAQAYLPILKAQDRRNNIKRPYHIREIIKPLRKEFTSFDNYSNGFGVSDKD